MATMRLAPMEAHYRRSHRMNRDHLPRFSPATLIVVIAIASGCESENANTPTETVVTTDATPATDDAIGIEDSGADGLSEPDADTSPGEPDADTSVETEAGETGTPTDACTWTGFEPQSLPNALYDWVTDTWSVSAQADGARLYLGFKPSTGGNENATQTGDYVIGATAEDLSPWTCTTCVYGYRAGPNGSEQVYFGVSGTIRVTELNRHNGSFVGSLENVVLAEFTPGAFMADWAPVPGGKTWCMNGVSLANLNECGNDLDCQGSSRPVCNRTLGHCVECRSSFDCHDANAPVCHDPSDVGACVPGPELCADDDALEPNDGPADATPLVPDVPLNASLCVDGRQGESDTYVFTITEPTKVSVRASWFDDGTPVWGVILDGEGQYMMDTNTDGERFSELGMRAAAPGTYYVEYTLNGPVAPAHPYTIVLTTQPIP